jgi:hydrogenase nickel incorporation protein HypB
VLDDFNPERAEAHLRALANPAPVLRLSARKGQNMTAWLDWLRQEVRAQRQRVAARISLKPAIRPEGAQLHATHPNLRFRSA